MGKDRPGLNPSSYLGWPDPRKIQVACPRDEDRVTEVGQRHIKVEITSDVGW